MICWKCYRQSNPVDHIPLLKPQERPPLRKLTYQRTQEEERQYQERQEDARRQYEERLEVLPPRRCVACGLVKPAADFAAPWYPFHEEPSLRQRCHPCHQAMREEGYQPCCLCGRKMPPSKFIGTFHGYLLKPWWDALFLLCCVSCEQAFLALPPQEQRQHIRATADRAFPAGQVIYALSDPGTRRVRYIGRTGNLPARAKAHRRDRTAARSHFAPPFSKRNWIQALHDQGKRPDITSVYTVESGPLVVEWERRYIAHGIQQGWDLLNAEAQEKHFVELVMQAQVDFLHAPFETLVERSLFDPHGLEAFVRAWYDAADDESLEVDLEAAE